MIPIKILNPSISQPKTPKNSQIAFGHLCSVDFFAIDAFIRLHDLIHNSLVPAQKLRHFGNACNIRFIWYNFKHEKPKNLFVFIKILEYSYKSFFKNNRYKYKVSSQVEHILTVFSETENPKVSLWTKNRYFSLMIL